MVSQLGLLKPTNQKTTETIKKLSKKLCPQPTYIPQFSHDIKPEPQVFLRPDLLFPPAPRIPASLTHTMQRPNHNLLKIDYLT